MILANVAIPTVVPHMFAAAILLPIIATIEAVLIHRMLLLAYWPSFRLSLGANGRSTLVGLPVGYFFAALGTIPAGMFTKMIPPDLRELFRTTLFQTLYVGGLIPNPTIPFAMAIGLVVVLIPYFFASVVIEGRYMMRNLPKAEPKVIKRVAWRMNVLTYACLVAMAVDNLVSIAMNPSHSEQARIDQAKRHPEGEGRSRSWCQTATTVKEFTICLH